MVIRALIVVGLTGCTGLGVLSGPNADAMPVWVTAEWNLHDATTGARLLCEPGETVEITIGSEHHSAPCAPPSGTTYPNVMSRVNMHAPLGAQNLRVELVDPTRGSQGVFEHAVVVDSGEYLDADIPVTTHDTVGQLAFAWLLKTPGGGVCGGALRESLVFTIGGGMYTLPAAQWNAGLPLGPIGGWPPDTGLISGVPIGAQSVTVALINTQSGTVEDHTVVSALVVGGRTAIADPFVFPNCPY